MNKTKTIISAIVIFIGCLGGFLYKQNLKSTQIFKINEGLHQQDTTLRAELKKSIKRISELQDEINSNQRYIVKLKHQLSNMKEEVHLITNRRAINSNNSTIEPPKEAITSSESPALLSIVKRIQNGEKLADIQSYTQSSFSNEEIDNDWAYEYESNIRDFIAADVNNNFDLQSVTCKSTACEVKIFTNENSAMQVGTLFAKQISEQKWRNSKATLMFNDQITDGVMSIVVGRDETTLK